MRIFILLSLLYSLGCGVKGKPLAPLQPTPIGRGELSFQKAAEQIQLGPKKKAKPPGDWDEEEDFTQ
ncbi:MAG: hypothetical protein LW875_07870 [Proteobacteria bacterium]|jgi:hypothetical protein|nr:hypothetical protein [Pseudomonadota bacterium]